MKLKVYRRPGSKMYQMSCWAGGKRHRESTRVADERKAWKIGREWERRLEEHDSVARVEVSLSVAIDTFIENCRESGLAKTTVDHYRGRLTRFLGYTGDQDLSEWTPDDAYDRVAQHLVTRSHEVADTKHDRLVLSAFFNYLRAKRWYKGANPADAKLHGLRRPRHRLKKPARCTTREEDLVLRREGHKSILWPVILLTRWAGMRRGEACTLRWSELDLEQGYADVVGHELGRKHPRRVWLAPWVVMQLRSMRPAWQPEPDGLPLWLKHPDTATHMMDEFCGIHFARRITFNDLRASFVTEGEKRGLTPTEESKIVGHSVEIAQRHYSEYEARNARWKLPPDPLTEADAEPEGSGVDAGTDAKVAQK